MMETAKELGEADASTLLVRCCKLVVRPYVSNIDAGVGCQADTGHNTAQ